jgi:small subunit ribosomal protein S21
MKPQRNSNEGSKRGLYVEVKNNDIGKALRRFKKMVQDDGILQELKERESFVKPSIQKARAKAAGIARWKKKQASQRDL